MAAARESRVRGGWRGSPLPPYDGPVAVRLRGPLKTLAGGRAEHPVDGATVVDLPRELERSQPAVSGGILGERGLVRRHINVFVNGEYGGEQIPVADGDRVDVLPAISGGASA